MNILRRLANSDNLQRKSVRRLDFDSSLQNRLNIEKFQLKLGKNGNSKGAILTADELLMHASKSLPTSLLKMSTPEAQSAVEMFDAILHFIQLTNGPSNAKRRVSILQKISDKGQSSPLKDELYLQLLKQTRGNADPAQEKNAWKLFVAIASNSPCPEELLGLVSNYAKSVCLDREEDPMIRSMAFKVLSALKNCQSLQSTTRQQLSGQLFACRVFLVDGTVHELVYDLDMVVPEALEQLAWSLGLPNMKNFALYIDTGRDHIRLDETVAFVKQVPSKNGIEGRLLFKKEFFRRKDKNITDPDYVHYCYIQSKQQYLDGGYPVRNEQVAILSFLQITAEHESSIFEDTQALPKAVAHTIPRKVFNSRVQEDWNLDVMQCRRELGAMTKVDAQIQFLNVVRRIPYGNSLLFRVWTKGYFPVDLPEHTELRMLVNYHNVCFFTPDTRQCLVSTEASNLFACTFSDQELTMKFGWITEWCSFQLETDHGEEICKAVHMYKRDSMRSKSMISAKGRSKLAVHPVPEATSPRQKKTDSISPRRRKPDSTSPRRLKIDSTSPHHRKTDSGTTDEFMADMFETDSSFLTSGDDRTISEPPTPRASEATHTQSHTASTLSPKPSLEAWKQLESGANRVGSHGSSAGVKTEATKKSRAKASRHKQRRMKRTDWDLLLQQTKDDSQSPRSTMSDQEQVDSYTAEAQPLAIQADTEKTKWDMYEESTLPLDSLNDLKPGFIFARRYKIKSNRVGTDKFLAQDIKTREKVLLKFYSSAAQFESSWAFHRRLARSQYVCKLLDVVNRQVGYPWCLVFERGDETLYQYLDKEEPSKEQRIAALKQILLALADIHSRGFVHCDLRPSNVMLFRSVNKWKVLEFDSASPAGRPTQTNTTVTYAAPEIVVAEKEGQTEIIPHTSGDLWSFGIIAHELLTGERIYGEVTAERVRELLLARGPLPGIEKLEDDCARSLIEQLLQKDHRHRPSAEKASNHQFFEVDTDFEFSVK